MLKRRKTNLTSIAIDPGAFHTRIVSNEHGVLLDQESVGVIDMDHRIGGVAAAGPFGNQAQQQLETGNKRLRRIRPVQSDRQNELGFSAKMLNYFIDDTTVSGVLGDSAQCKLVLPKNVQCHTASQMLKICSSAGASNAQLTDGALCAFYGMQVDHKKPCIIIDLGAVDSRVIAIADGDVQFHQTLQCGGDDMDQILVQGIYEQFGMLISQTDARHIKHRLGSATPRSLVKYTRDSMQVTCLSPNTNTTSEFSISSDLVSMILQPQLSTLLSSITLAFSTIDANLKTQAYETGIQLCGGGALLTRIDQLVMEATDLPVEVAERPMTCAVRGAILQPTNEINQVAECA